MAAFSGTAGSVLFYSVVVGQVSEWSLDFSATTPEITVFGDSWDAFVPSVRTVTGSFMGDSDAIGTALAYARPRNAFLDGDNQYELYFYQDADNEFRINNAQITSMAPGVNVKGKGEISYAFSGELSSSVYNP